MRFLALMICILSIPLSISTLSAGDLDIRETRGLSEANVLRAVEILRENCQPLGGPQWEELQNVTAKLEPEFASHRSAKGWKHHLLITAEVPNKPKLIPGYAREPATIAGHRLFFYLGGGHSPGMFIGKRAVKYLCGMSASDGDDVFVSIPALEFLN